MEGPYLERLHNLFVAKQSLDSEYGSALFDGLETLFPKLNSDEVTAISELLYTRGISMKDFHDSSAHYELVDDLECCGFDYAMSRLGDFYG